MKKRQYLENKLREQKEKLLYKEFMSKDQPETPNWIITAENAAKNISNNINIPKDFGIPITYMTDMME